MVREDEYLETNSMEELIRKYQSIIRKVDCSISEKNVRKTCLILRELQNVAGKRE